MPRADSDVVSSLNRAGAALRVRLSRVGRSPQGEVERTSAERVVVVDVVVVVDRERSELRAVPFKRRAATGVGNLCGKTDHLRGIKENVIMGRLIPAGAGLPAYKKLQVVIDEKSPTYAPPTYARVQPALLVAVGDE